MMKLYAVVDKKAKDIVSVFPSVSDEAAERSFLMLLTGPQNIFTDFPEDFAVYPVAELRFDNRFLSVSAHNIDHVIKSGFNVDNFKVTECIKDGSDYDKRYLSVVRSDRLSILSSFDDDSKLDFEEVSNDE